MINDAPTTAGLNNITARLCALPERLTTAEQREFFAKMKAACPAVPVEEAEFDGKKVRKLAPAEKYAKQRSNCENPELYAIWPFRLYGLGKPGLDEAVAAYTHRLNHLDVGWGYDGNCAALLGLTDEAARILKVKCRELEPRLPLAGHLGTELRLAARPGSWQQPAGDDAVDAAASGRRRDSAFAGVAEAAGTFTSSCTPRTARRSSASTAAAGSSNFASSRSRGERTSFVRLPNCRIVAKVTAIVL